MLPPGDLALRKVANSDELGCGVYFSTKKQSPSCNTEMTMKNDFQVRSVPTIPGYMYC